MVRVKGGGGGVSGQNVEIFEFDVFVPITMDFVLSTPKYILNLLSTNQSHSVLKYLFSLFSISFISFPSYARQESSAYNSRSHVTACDMLLT